MRLSLCCAGSLPCVALAAPAARGQYAVPPEASSGQRVGSARSKATTLPVLNGGFDQQQIVFGFMRRFTAR